METYAEMVELVRRAEDCQARLKNLQSRKMGSKNLGSNEGSSFRGQAVQLQKSQNKDIKKEFPQCDVGTVTNRITRRLNAGRKMANV